MKKITLTTTILILAMAFSGCTTTQGKTAEATKIQLPGTKITAYGISFNTINLKDCPDETIVYKNIHSDGKTSETQFLIKGCKEDSKIKLNIEQREIVSEIEKD